MTLRYVAGKVARQVYNRFRSPAYLQQEAPASYRVVAFMPVYNEADILGTTLRRLGESGVQVYALDSWSTDGSWELIQKNAGGTVIGAERNPAEGPSPTHDLQRTAERIAALSAQMRPDWALWHDADEVFQAPWTGMPLRAALFRVDQERFNAIWLEGITFPPVDNSFRPGMDFVEHFRRWAYPVSTCSWIRGWKGAATDVRIFDGSHDARFAHRYVYPAPFLLRHYPIRSQAHGETKVFRERRPRYSAAGRARGWHVHYDGLSEGDSFLQDPERLHRLNEETLYGEVRAHTPKMPCRICAAAAAANGGRKPESLGRAGHL